tara:strand:- start:79 stop:525 length:447 start_codon:yes stop_codon:yes gene_type:complete
MNKILIIIFVFIMGCGYQPIYVNKQQDNYVFKSIKLIGDRKINKKIVTALNLKEDNNLVEENKIILTSDKKIEETSKDSKGKVQSFRTLINVKLIIQKNKKIVDTKKFSVNFSYNNKENNFDLANYQKEIENNLTTQIIQKILMHLSL